jgi:hypothetical protein
VNAKPPIIPSNEARPVEVEVLPPESSTAVNGWSAAAGVNPERVRSATRFRVALGLAMLVDAVQIGLFPLFAPGFASVANVAVDSAAFLSFLLLIGWHPALLPGFILEQVPLLGIVPTWTLAVWLAARRHLRTEDLPPESKATGAGPLP